MPVTQEYYRRKPVQQRSRQRVAAILTAAKDGVETLGYDHLTMSGIADDAGVPLSAVYQYFSSKSAIMTALIEQHHLEVNDAIAQIEATNDVDHAVVQVAEMVDRYFEIYLGDPALVHIWFGSQTSPELNQICHEQNIVKAAHLKQAFLPLCSGKGEENLEIQSQLLIECIAAAARVVSSQNSSSDRQRIIESTKKALAAMVRSFFE